MDLTQFIVTIAGAALIALNLWFFFGNKDAARAVAKDKGGLYACPMHPWITSNDPTADCSICGMKLVESDEAGK